MQEPRRHCGSRGPGRLPADSRLDSARRGDWVLAPALDATEGANRRTSPANKMRSQGELPAKTHFKVSAHCGHGNPASAKLLEEIGANSFNPVRDLQIPMMSAIRRSIDISLDLHMENPKSSGGFIRHYEAPEIIRSAAPVYLKTGGAVAAHHGWETTKSQAAERVRQVYLVQSMIDRYYPDAKISNQGTEDMSIPNKSGK